MKFEQVLDFWFKELTPQQWYQKNDELDLIITERFLEAHTAIVCGEFFEWRSSALGRLAEIIVLDQFSRNMFRDTAQSFAYDSLALILAQEAIHIGADKELRDSQKAFLYMPYMHSESQIIHEQAIRLFSIEGMNHNLKYEIQHKKIIDQFGRYPHRNKILGRVSTQEEIDFLKQPNSAF